MAIPGWRCQDCGEDYDGCTCALANKVPHNEMVRLRDVLKMGRSWHCDLHKTGGVSNDGKCSQCEQERSVDKQYPLTSKWLGLRVEDPSGTAWISADDLERVLEKGVKVHGFLEQDGVHYWQFENEPDDTHQALLIGIRELKPKTKEKRAMEIVSELARAAMHGQIWDVSGKNIDLVALASRAKALIEEDGVK